MLVKDPVITIDLELKGWLSSILTSSGFTPKFSRSLTSFIFSFSARNSNIKFEATGPISLISNKSSFEASKKAVILLKFKARFNAVASPTSRIPNE